MRLENVVAGRTIDGKERIFEQKIVQEAGCVYTIYIDLKTKEEFICFNVDMDSLIPYKELFPNRKYLFKKKVVKTFKNDMKMLYHVDNLFIGNLYRVRWIYEGKMSEFDKKNNRLMDINFIEGNRLFVKVCDTEFKDLRTGKVYKKNGEDTLNVGDLCVSDLRNSNQLLELSFDGTLVSKQYALRKHYQKYKK